MDVKSLIIYVKFIDANRLLRCKIFTKLTNKNFKSTYQHY